MIDSPAPTAELDLEPLPPRIQMLQWRGYLLPKDAVRCDGISEFANPFRWMGSVGGDGDGGEWWVERRLSRWAAKGRLQAMQMAFDLHADWLLAPEQKARRNQVRHAFRGKRPACFCRLDEPCCGDTLALVAATEEES